MKIGTLSKACMAALLAVSMAGCSSWDSMSRRQKSTVGGAALGGVAGAVITNGGILGTVGGAAIGGGSATRSASRSAPRPSIENPASAGFRGCRGAVGGGGRHGFSGWLFRVRGQIQRVPVPVRGQAPECSVLRHFDLDLEHFQ